MAALACLTACSRLEVPAEVRAAEPLVPEVVSYNWHVRPILSDKCFGCHGPQQDAKAGLQLSAAATAYAPLPESPDRVAIAPGKPAASELIRRILSADADEVMPPPKASTISRFAK